MLKQTTADYLKQVLTNMPSDWLRLTTHRLDIYDESRAKTQFTEAFAALAQAGDATATTLSTLPTAYDYVRLGHPLSCILEWALADARELPAVNVISFSSRTMPVFAVLRKNLLEGKPTRIIYQDDLPAVFDADLLRNTYGYTFELVASDASSAHDDFAGTTILLTDNDALAAGLLPTGVDFVVASYAGLGSVLYATAANGNFVADIQHVRRRESIAMTPANCLTALQQLVSAPTTKVSTAAAIAAAKAAVRSVIREVTATATKPLVGSSGLSVQYAIMMGLVDAAREQHPGKAIKFVVPPNCYGGTNDQARRVAAAVAGVAVVDLPVDGDNDMVRSVQLVLDQLAAEDAIPYIIAEIPTNPRVEVPDLDALKAALSKERTTPSGTAAIPPVFILDQTFCPNVHFLGAGDTLSTVPAIAYASGSKFPSGGRVTAGYCVGNVLATELMDKVERHLLLCDNEATDLQYTILAEQLPSMNARIAAAYRNTREFVDFIEEVLPSAKINFVSHALASRGFTPSVFSLDLPTKGATDAEREAYKRALNHRLIEMMITQIPEESKYCVSYGQLKGCYWTIPATSTQGTTKEADKDYIARVSLSPEMDLERHKAVFRAFLAEI